MKALGIIPARVGSKGIPGKNIRLLHGKPLLAYAVEAAKASGVVDHVILSTDSEEIAEVGREAGAEVPFLRPPEMAGDEAPMCPVLQHAVRTYEEMTGFRPDWVFNLQPTAPLRKPEHLRRAMSIAESTDCDSVVSVVEVPRELSPYYVMKIEDGLLKNFLPEGAKVTRRQDAPPVYSREGTCYLVRCEVLLQSDTLYGSRCVPMILPANESVNLDSEEDWQEAERVMG